MNKIMKVAAVCVAVTLCAGTTFARSHRGHNHGRGHVVRHHNHRPVHHHHHHHHDEAECHCHEEHHHHDHEHNEHHHHDQNRGLHQFLSPRPGTTTQFGDGIADKTSDLSGDPVKSGNCARCGASIFLPACHFLTYSQFCAGRSGELLPSNFDIKTGRRSEARTHDLRFWRPPL